MVVDVGTGPSRRERARRRAKSHFIAASLIAYGADVDTDNASLTTMGDVEAPNLGFRACDQTHGP